MIEGYSDKLRTIIGKVPIIKRLLKIIFNRPLNHRREREILLYNKWLQQYDLDNNAIIKQKKTIDNFEYKPLISIITPTYNTPTKYFIEMIESVLNQTYPNWELVLVDDASSNENIRDLIKEYAKRDLRIKYKFLKTNQHIAGATNEAIKIAKGEFISLFDHDDTLQIDALFEIVCALNHNKGIDFIYTDEDKITGDDSQRSDPFFKPDWNPDFLHSINYITHFTTIRKTVLDEFGYENSTYNGAQDWELFLRLTRNMQKDKIYHIAKILYHWRVHEASTAMSVTSKPYVIESQKKAVEEDINRKNLLNFTLNQDTIYPGQWQLTLMPTSTPKISILVFNEKMRKYINNNMTYEDYEVILISKDDNIVNILSKISGEYLVTVDMTIKIKGINWIELLLGDAERLDIGFVAARYNKDANIMRSISYLINKSELLLLNSLSNRSLTKHYYATARYNLPRIQEGCVFMVGVDKLRKVLDTEKIDCNIIDLSSDIVLHGYRNLYNPYVKL